MEQPRPQNVFIHRVTQVATASGSLNRSGRSSVTVQVLPPNATQNATATSATRSAPRPVQVNFCMVVILGCTAKRLVSRSQTITW